jgi:hypothetical protein
MWPCQSIRPANVTTLGLLPRAPGSGEILRWAFYEATVRVLQANPED